MLMAGNIILSDYIKCGSNTDVSPENRALKSDIGMQVRAPNPLQTQTSQTFIVVFYFIVVNCLRLTLAKTLVHSTFEMRNSIYNQNLVEVNLVVSSSSRKLWGANWHGVV